MEQQQADLAAQFETKPGGEAGQAAEEAGEAAEKEADASGANGVAALAATGDQPGGDGTKAEAKVENGASNQ